MKKNRYGSVAKRTEYNGRTYDSKWEAKCAATLDLLVKARRMDFWLPQVKVPLGPDFDTRVDFLCFDGCANNEIPGAYFVEAKGAENERFRTVRRLWKKHGPLDLHILKKGKPEEVVDAART